MPDPFRSPKVVKLEQQNEALLAQVEELRNAIHAYAGTGRDEQWQEVKRAVVKTSQQSLDSLKARIEEEAIAKCAALVIKGRPNRMGEYLKEDIEAMPRKYQPTEGE